MHFGPSQSRIGHIILVVFAGEDVTYLRLREKQTRVRIKNKDAKYSWQRNRTELVPSGLLLFDEGPSSYDSLFKDTKTRKIEDRLSVVSVNEF